MPWDLVILLILYLIGQLWLYSVCDNEKSKKFYVPVKTVCSCSFLAIACYIAAFYGTRFSFMKMLPALVFCLAGDVFMGLGGVKLKNKKLYLGFGILCFMCAHVGFLDYLYSLDPSVGPMAFFLPVLLTALVALLFRFLHFKLGRLRVPAIVYTLFVASVLAKCISYGMENPGKDGMLIAFAGILFYISDSLDAFLHFYHIHPGTGKKVLHIINLATYYFAVMAFVLTLG